MITYYIEQEHSCPEGMGRYTSLTKFKPTGRWKIVVCGVEVTLYLEHQGWLFKSWWGEDRLVEKVERKEFINECLNSHAK